MYMKKTIVDENKLIELIKMGNGLVDISKILNIGFKSIYRISKNYYLYDKLKENNQLYKHRKIEEVKELTKKRYNELNLYINMKFGENIRECIINKNYTTNDVWKQIKLPRKQVIRYLMFYNLYDTAVLNGKKKQAMIARECGKLSALTLTGVPLKPITDGIVKRFEQLKSILIYKEMVYRELKKEFGFGEKKCKQLCELYGYPKDNPQTGRLNPMYGKSPGKGAGIGIKCHINCNGNIYFCRSSLELKIFIYLLENNIKFAPSRHRIKYKMGGINRTYCPDIVINDVEICEIKPYKLLTIVENVLKYSVLKKYCNEYNLKCKYITENTFDLSKLNLAYIDELINKKIIDIDDKNYEKLKRNIL